MQNQGIKKALHPFKANNRDGKAEKKSMIAAKKFIENNTHKPSVKFQKANETDETPLKVPNIFLKRLQVKAFNLDIKSKGNNITSISKTARRHRSNNKVLRKEHEFNLWDEDSCLSEEDCNLSDESFHFTSSCPVIDSNLLEIFDNYASGVHVIEKRRLPLPNLPKELESLSKREASLLIAETHSVPQTFIIDVTQILPINNQTHDKYDCKVCHETSKIKCPERLALIQVTLVDPDSCLFDIQLAIQWSMSGLNKRLPVIREWFANYTGNSIEKIIFDLVDQVHTFNSADIIWSNCAKYEGRECRIKRPLIEASPLDYFQENGRIECLEEEVADNALPTILTQPIHEWPITLIDESIEMPCDNCLQCISSNESYQLNDCKHVICRLCWIEQVEEFLNVINTATEEELFFPDLYHLKCPIYNCQSCAENEFILQFVESFLLQPFFKAQDFIKSIKTSPMELSDYQIFSCSQSNCNFVIMSNELTSDSLVNIKCSCTNEILCCSNNRNLYTPWPFCGKVFKNQQHVSHWPMSCLFDHESASSPSGNRLNILNEERARLVKDKKIKRFSKEFSSLCGQFHFHDFRLVVNQFLNLAQSCQQLADLDKKNGTFLVMQSDKIVNEVKHLLSNIVSDKNIDVIHEDWRQMQNVILSIVKQVQCIKSVVGET